MIKSHDLSKPETDYLANFYDRAIWIFLISIRDNPIIEMCGQHSFVRLEKKMKFKPLIWLYLFCLGGFVISTWVFFNPMWIEIFSIGLILATVLALPALYHLGLNLLAQSTRLNIIVRLMLRAAVLFLLLFGCAYGWHYGMWGSLEVQPISLSIAIVSTGGLMLIKYYWGSYLL